MVNAIEVKNISKTFKIPQERRDTLREHFWNFFRPVKYKNFVALRDISFEVKKGEWFGIIGRNGSGKSTLLKIIAGVYQPDSGQIMRNGKIVPFLELGVGFNNELSGRENIFLNGTLLGITRAELEKKFDEIVDFAEVGDFINMPLKNYSSGMQVRLAFAIAIHANCDILLMDEVLAVGDTNFQSKCFEEFRKFREKGKTIILVTHDITAVQKYCSRAMLLRNGRVEIIGDSDKVGTKYMYQNMSDEEKRIFREEKKGKEIEENNKQETKKEKIAEILKVEFLDKNGKSKNVFETGEAINIKIYFKINKTNNPINIGVGLHAVTGGQVFGYNTQLDGYIITKNKKFIILHFDHLPLLKGEYFLNVACSKDVGGVNCDFKPKCKILKIYSRGLLNNYIGIVNIKHEWKQ